jgi:hypothetical protein
MNFFSFFLGAFGSVLLFLAGCGGGTSSSSGGGTTTSLTISGVASSGKPLVNGTVTCKDFNGNFASTSLDSLGAYSINVTTMTAPFRIRANGFSGGIAQELYSVALEPGVANVNPLSHIALAESFGSNNPKNAFDSAGIGNITTATVQAAVNSMRTNLLNSFTAQGFSGANIDPITTAMAANGQGLDRVFDFIDFKINTTSGAVTVKNRADGLSIATVTRGNLADLANSGTVLTTRVIDLANKTALEITALIPTLPLGFASEISILNPQNSSSSTVQSLSISPSRLSKALYAVLQVDALPPDSDYFEDEAMVYVEDRSTDSFDTINEILCSIEQSRYEEMLNQGPYIAQIDITQCESDADSAENAVQDSQNQSSGSGQPEYEFWTQDSSRVDNDSDHIIKTWVHLDSEGEEDPAALIRVLTVITESSSEANPYGIFELNFKAHPLDSQGLEDTSTTVFTGFLKTERNSADQVILSFTMEGSFVHPQGSVQFNQQAALNRDPDGEDGSGRMAGHSTANNQHGTFADTFDFSVAFSESHFLRSGADGERCFSRDQFSETAWRYGLYDELGSRVSRNSGFPILYDDGSSTHNGWIGYWGFWFPGEVQVPHGATVSSLSEDGQSSTTYSIFKAPGKMIRHTKEILSLGEITNVPLSFYEPQSGAEFQVVWNGTNFAKTAQLIQDQNTREHTWNALSPAQAIVPGPNDFAFAFWSQSLGGNGFVQLKGEGTFGPVDLTIDNSSPLVFHREDVVYPDDSTVPASLACFQQCPDSSQLNTSSQDPFHPNVDFLEKTTAQLAAGTDYILYGFNSPTLTLSEGGNPISVTTSTEAFRFGSRSGPLIDPADLSYLSCTFGPAGFTVERTCGWRIWTDVPVFYTWETGINEWNQFSGLQDPSDDSFLTFEAPLRLHYSHSRENSTTTAFILDYNGFGNLHGIPGKCVDQDSGEDAQCSQNTRWIPEFTIPDGTTVSTQTNAGSQDYLLKAQEKEQRMAQVTSTNCSSLQTSPFTLPTLEDWQDPSIGAEPTVTSPAKVIGGILQ